MSGLTAAIDVGGTKIAGALVQGRAIAFRTERSTPGPPGAADPGSRALRSVARELAEAALEPALELALDPALDGRRPVSAVGLGCCEYVSEGRLTSREVLDWTEQPRDWLPEIFPGARVSVDSDVRCGLLAEQSYGALRGADSAVFVSWGTGVSSALLLDGRVWAGAHGRAIALGELPAPDSSTVERFCSGAGMLARWQTLGAPPEATTRDLLAATTDSVATEIAHSAGRVLAAALRSVVHLLDPAVIVLGGGLGAADTAARQAALLAWTDSGTSTPLVTTAVGPDGPLLGAALAADRNSY